MDQVESFDPVLDHRPLVGSVSIVDQHHGVYGQTRIQGRHRRFPDPGAAGRWWPIDKQNINGVRQHRRVGDVIPGLTARDLRGRQRGVDDGDTVRDAQFLQELTRAPRVPVAALEGM